MQGIVMVLVGIRLALTRNQGSISGLACYLYQALTVDNPYLHATKTIDLDSSNKRSFAIDFLKHLAIGLTFLLMYLKQKPVRHSGAKFLKRKLYSAN